MYVSGRRAAEVAACFAGSLLETPVISERIGAASALKMGYAAYTKGGAALLTAILGMVEREGVRADLARQWGDAFTERTVRRICANTANPGASWAGCTRSPPLLEAPACLEVFTRPPPKSTSVWRCSRTRTAPGHRSGTRGVAQGRMSWMPSGIIEGA